MSRRTHAHVPDQFHPPERCAICGERWRHVIDGREGRARRQRQMRLFDEIETAK